MIIIQHKVLHLKATCTKVVSLFCRENEIRPPSPSSFLLFLSLFSFHAMLFLRVELSWLEVVRKPKKAQVENFLGEKTFI